VALYTGSRSGVVCTARFRPLAGKGFIDLDRGVFYRAYEPEAATKKRKPPVRIPRRLLGHMRRWHANGALYGVEYNRLPVRRINKAFRAIVAEAGLPPAITPHVLRHTAATWLAQGGAGRWGRAGFLGMTEETFETVYGHHDPEFQSDIEQAFSRRQVGDR
jgi:integrase